uniref:Elsinochromes biosynthesis cluster protein HP2 n=1 Tax=Elsinoe fawcettii TaxID=40997 RepID=HP2_ELSFA|nr:RecName: Full=Elsinochromes biosynthesis cluster protein HP2; Flags: Precursor [Elsinoe fawcettii]ABZ82010.1 hypothetical protein EfHP2 [Elsinoe fawcettii]
MVLLYILIMVALIPMYMTVVQDATFSHPPPGLLIPEAWSGSGSIRLWTDAQEIPVRCFWKLVYDPRIHPETAAIQQGDSIMYMYSGTRFLDYRTVLSALLLTFVFFWRMLSMFDRSRNRFQRACVSIPSALLEVCRQKAIKKTATLPFYGQALYFGIMCLYTAHIVLWDFLNSFAGTLWLITLNLANGTAQIINLRKERHRNRHDEESSWTFGQIVPIVLLVSPLVAAFEDLLSKRSRRALREGSVGNTSLNEVDLTPEPSLTEATTLSLHTRPLIYSVPTSITQSSIASQKSSGTPAQDLIRSSWPYAILFWELHVLLAFMVIWLPLAQSQLFIFRYAYWEAYYAFPAAVGTFWLTVVIAVPFSSIGRSSYPCPKPRRSGLNVA